ncbi:hypothetical protein CERZMDRAFT_89776 [Cercospora zeae-maydis SCOH1-5]|uniref:Uncharacterized protein n=1 Tax=Cercospora zeae-maydis SCOH1-5 TaxID=717836 RepID=A0A6A6FUV9_9PEZI|nr:hypothetical protein CERZMDRAFT_89776 [Cercospora zeae-maydis SCOH1-5]
MPFFEEGNEDGSGCPMKISSRSSTKVQIAKHGIAAVNGTLHEAEGLTGELWCGWIASNGVQKGLAVGSLCERVLVGKAGAGQADGGGRARRGGRVAKLVVSPASPSRTDSGSSNGVDDTGGKIGGARGGVSK